MARAEGTSRSWVVRIMPCGFQVTLSSSFLSEIFRAHPAVAPVAGAPAAAAAGGKGRKGALNDGADSGPDDVTDPESDSENENDAPGADGPDLLTPGGQLWIAAGPGYRLAMYLHKVGPQLLWEQAHFTGNLCLYP